MSGTIRAALLADLRVGILALRTTHIGGGHGSVLLADVLSLLDRAAEGEEVVMTRSRIDLRDLVIELDIVDDALFNAVAAHSRGEEHCEMADLITAAEARGAAYRALLHAVEVEEDQ